MGPTWGPSGADRTQVGLMLAPWNLLSGMSSLGSSVPYFFGRFEMVSCFRVVWFGSMWSFQFAIRLIMGLASARFVFRIVGLFWNLTGISAAWPSRRLLNYRVIPISRVRDFMRPYDKASCRILKHASGFHVMVHLSRSTMRTNGRVLHCLGNNDISRCS